jgi:hypothetical protein
MTIVYTIQCSLDFGLEEYFRAVLPFRLKFQQFALNNLHNLNIMIDHNIMGQAHLGILGCEFNH